MQIEIVCPYCGKNMQITIDPTKKIEAVCELCGSPLIDEVKTALATSSGMGSPLASIPSSPSFSKGSFPSLEQTKPTKDLSPNPESSGQLPPSPLPTQSKMIKTVTRPTGGEAWLVLPQLNQKIIIPFAANAYHFGRNVILPLVSPQTFDVEWLNSISRVRKQNAQVVGFHFVITRGRTGQFFIEDMQSRWGTWINRQQIKGRGEMPLKNGDRIELVLSKPNVKEIYSLVIEFYA